LLFCWSFYGFSQELSNDSSRLNLSLYYKVTTVTNSKYTGKIINDNGKEILLFCSDSVKVYIPKVNIKSINSIEIDDPVINGEYQNVGPFSTRYHLMTNSLPMKKGQNYTLLHLWGPEVHFTITNSTSIGIVSSWILSPFALALKQNFKTRNKKLNFSIGNLIGTSSYFEKSIKSIGTIKRFAGAGNLLYGNVTYGSRKSNVTLTGGFTIFKSGIEKSYHVTSKIVYPQDYGPGTVFYSSCTDTYVRPISFGGLIGLSGMHTISKKISFVYDALLNFSKLANSKSGENIFKILKYDRYFVTLMPGIRFQKKEKSAFQITLGVVGMIDEVQNYTLPYPMCSWLIKF